MEGLPMPRIENTAREINVVSRRTLRREEWQCSMHRRQGDGIQRHAVVIQQPRDWQSDTAAAVEVGRVGISRIRGYLHLQLLTGDFWTQLHLALLKTDD